MRKLRPETFWTNLLQSQYDHDMNQASSRQRRRHCSGRLSSLLISLFCASKTIFHSRGLRDEPFRVLLQSSSCERAVQRLHFLVGVRRIGQGLGNFLTKQFAESLSQPVNRHAHGAF